jgi:hypothetical protein
LLPLHFPPLNVPISLSIYIRKSTFLRKPLHFPPLNVPILLSIYIRKSTFLRKEGAHLYQIGSEHLSTIFFGYYRERIFMAPDSTMAFLTTRAQRSATGPAKKFKFLAIKH